jgi:hypothetical protein
LSGTTFKFFRFAILVANAAQLMAAPSPVIGYAHRAILYRVRMIFSAPVCIFRIMRWNIRRDSGGKLR